MILPCILRRTRFLQTIHIGAFLMLPWVSILAQPVGDQEKRVCKRTVPVTVLDAFRNQYSTAQKVKYYREIEDQKVFWEIDFWVQKVHRVVKYETNGTLSETEQVVGFSSLTDTLQSSIRSYLNQKFKSYRIKKTELILHPQDQNPKLIEVTIWSRRTPYYGVSELYFNLQGQPVKERDYEFQSTPTQF